MPYTPGLEGGLPALSDDIITITLAAQASALPAGTAVTAAGAVATSKTDPTFLGVTLQPIEVSATAKSVSVIYDDIVQGNSGSAITKGAAVSVGASGKFNPSVSGDFIAGVALSAASAADQPVQILITRAGFRP